MTQVIDPLEFASMFWPQVRMPKIPEDDLYDLIKQGRLLVTQKSPIEWRFWHRVNKDGPVHPTLGKCWQWIGYLMKNGYGKSGAMGLAHRRSWSICVGPIPNGSKVLHRCDNPACVNPKHLFLGTMQDNTDDMIAKGRDLMRGEQQGGHKLTDEQVIQIRKRYRRYSHQHGCGAIARDLNISLTEVWRIVKGIRWQHV